MLPNANNRRARHSRKFTEDALWLFGMHRAPRLAYHQLTEVRGLLSNLINNNLMRALVTRGYQPYLFFPDGVVYFVTEGQQAALDIEHLTDMLWGEIGATLAGMDNSSKDLEVSEDGEENEEKRSVKAAYESLVRKIILRCRQYYTNCSRLSNY